MKKHEKRRHSARSSKQKTAKRSAETTKYSGATGKPAAAWYSSESLSKSTDGSDQTPARDSSRNRDINSKTIFRNANLCAQFLRDNFDMPILRDVRPEDIEDISERFYPYLGTEFEADSVKRIRILDIEKKRKDGTRAPSFLVSLIEHKSLVDYDVSMQLLRYMVCIWTEYRREQEAKQEGSTNRKRFRYPVIIPVVYYEGRPEWTAGMRLSDRIGGTDIFKGNAAPAGNGRAAGNDISGLNEWIRKWIPDFEYELIRIHDFSDQELLNRGNEMSLIMLINKIQNAADLEQFIHIPPDRMDKIVQKSPKAVVNIIAEVVENLCFKIDVSAEERLQCVQKVKERRMGYLFENMDKMSLQEERRKTEEQRKKTEEERRKTEEQRKRADLEKRKAEEQRKRADLEKRKAEEEKRRADSAEEKLRLAEEELKRLKEKYSI